jgi:lysophospholipase L1-like esterase
MPAADLLPKTWTKLQQKQPLHVLAWGDSVTDGGQASDDAHRYQSRFVTQLRKQFAGSQITLTTTAWGGRNTDSFLKEPPGSPHNFEHYVLDQMPDLIVMEFVNDAYMSPEVVEEKYSYLLKRFQEIGAEWVILTPHFVRPDWMNEKSVRVEKDPRPYVAGLRQFAEKHHVALADASLRWGHLVKEGIPYITLLCNSINHPDDRGHEMFAQALMELFR